MPKDHIKRGKKEKKRKAEEEGGDVAETEAGSPKKQKRSTEEEFVPVDAPIDADTILEDATDAPEQTVFYGLLDEGESEYFRKVDEVLDANEFEDAEARDLFLANVYKEASGKELKLANSQGCSRLMERLIAMSTPVQLKRLFQTFSGQ
jgi:nucleolar protein 9